MQQILERLNTPDYIFLVGTISGAVNLSDDRLLTTLLSRYENAGAEEDRAALCRAIASEVRYLGSSDMAYAFRRLSGRAPGVPFREIISDVARVLKVRLDWMGTDEELLQALVTEYATAQFAEMDQKDQQRMLEELGVDKQRAASFVKRSAGVFAPPLLIEAFNAVVIEGLIKKIILGTIARFLGSELTRKLFTFIVGRFPWWIGWIGPAVWAGSIGWTVVDLQGPAYRKTIPIVLYLGLCQLRSEGPEDA
ncbi:MAG: hypothetical protein KDD65_03585 [Bacteroidetes bacterium]|nr:hypothetical protein [Bacteroidota bacterium]